MPLLIYIYICMSVCMSVWMYASMHVCMYAFMWECCKYVCLVCVFGLCCVAGCFGGIGTEVTGMFFLMYASSIASIAQLVRA